ncbi:glycosyltransferase, partial [Escherichia coli]
MFKISIVTVVYNAANDLEVTINSVLKQTYKEIEYIVIDGASTDGTLDVLEKFKDKITTVVSEKDNGIYDAMNKSLQYVTGDW